MTVATRQALLSSTNNKLGDGVRSFSITAGETCPGKTKTCATLCYAMKNLFLMSSVIKSHHRNRLASHKRDFADNIIDEVRYERVRVLRIHVAGDFYSANYVRKWIKIVKASPRTQFYAYTRSWRDERMFPVLLRLAALPNMRLWFSTDKETGQAPIVAGINHAYLYGDNDRPDMVPNGTDLVFRNNKKGIAKRLAGYLVCPVENGVEYKAKMTCGQCRLCWRKDVLPSFLQRRD